MMYGSVEGALGQTRKARATSANVAALAAAGLAAVAVIALTSSLSPSSTSSLLQTHQVLGFQARPQATASQKAGNLIKQWAKNPALRKLMRHALSDAKGAAKSVHKFVSKVGVDLKGGKKDEEEKLSDIEHDLQQTGMDAEKTDLAYEAICHQEVRS